MPRNNIKRYNFILICFAVSLIDFILIFGFIGDIMIISGYLESYVFEQYGLFALIGSLIIEVVLFILSIIILIFSYRKYKYGQE